MSQALRLEQWLGRSPGPHGIGQAAILDEAAGYALRHVADLEAGAGALRAVADLAALREVVKADEAGGFRPLRGAPTLRRGWRMEGLAIGGLLEALNVLYPTAVADWAAWSDADSPGPEATDFAETAARQTGMYRITQVMTAGQLERTVRDVCAQGCLRRRLWRTDPAVVGTAASGAPAGLECLPLLCTEACNYFVAQARERIVADRKDAGE